MKKLKAFGLIGIVLVIALMSVSSVWAGPMKGTVAPPPPGPLPPYGMPAGAYVGTDIDEDDLPAGFLAGKVVETDGDKVTVCFLVPNDYIGHLHKLSVKVMVGGRWITVPSWGMQKHADFYRCAEVTMGGTYYMAKP
jgi:hypothetical protein